MLKGYRIDGIVSQDERDALRVVGFLEYAEALQRFDKLVAVCSAEELQAIEALLSRRDEFAIFTNLSRQFERAPGPLSEQPLGDKDRFERRGLKWMMALARVEVGGVLAGFTNLKRPFEAFPGTGYDRAEYAEMILDGLRTHYHVLKKDLKLDAVLKRKAPDVELLNYARSLVIAQAFCQAATKEWNGRLHAAQEAELKQWQASLHDWQNRMQRNVNQFLAQADNDRLTACQGACQKMLFRAAPNQ